MIGFDEMAARRAAMMPPRWPCLSDARDDYHDFQVCWAAAGHIYPELPATPPGAGRPRRPARATLPRRNAFTVEARLLAGMITAAATQGRFWADGFREAAAMKRLAARRRRRLAAAFLDAATGSRHRHTLMPFPRARMMPLPAKQARNMPSV